MKLLTAALIGYAIGSAPAGFAIVRLARGVDLRREGSGNVGATNVLRTSGVVLAVTVLLIDIAKGLISVMLTGPGETAVLGGTAAVVGHIYPVWLRFRGGKGVATATGAFAVIAPAATLYAALVFVVTVALTRYVSVGSIVAAGVLCVSAWWLGPMATAIGASVVTALILFAHRGNLTRLSSGTERRLGT